MPEQSRLPSGLVYQPELITKAEEQQALAVLETMAFSTITMHGRTARRTVRHFGLDYGYESWKLVPTDPLPGELAWLQERAGVLAGLDPGDFAQILISSRVGRLDPLPALAGRRRSGIGAGGGVLGRQLAAPRLGLIVAGLAAAAAGWGSGSGSAQMRSPGGEARRGSGAPPGCSTRWSDTAGRSCTTWPSPAARPTSIAMIPGAAVAVRSDPNIDRPGAFTVDLSTDTAAAAWRRPAGRT